MRKSILFKFSKKPNGNLGVRSNDSIKEHTKNVLNRGKKIQQNNNNNNKGTEMVIILEYNEDIMYSF
jgi:hypothetical protein